MDYVIGSFYTLLAIFLLAPSSAFTQSINLNYPTATVTVSEGDDYATDVLENPWDMSEKRDIGWEQHFDASTVNIDGGIWSGANSENDTGGYLFPLFPGFKGSLFAEGLPGDKTLPRFGINHKIDASKYTLLSYKLKHSSRSAFAIYWESDESLEQYWPSTSSPRVASNDGFYHWNTFYRNSGWVVYSHDLSNPAAFEQSQGTWSGRPYALRIDPSIVGSLGATTNLDWVRLVDPDSAPELNLSWSSSDISPFAVVTICVDTDASGYDGSPVARYTSGNNPGQHTIKTAIFPPGDYYFYIEAQTVDGGNFVGTPTRSNYSARLHVSAKPKLVWQNPSNISGEEYSASELGNAWDMTSSADVANLDESLWPESWRQFTSESFPSSADAQEGGKVFQALADAPWTWIGNNESDVQVHLNVPETKPIDTSKYRYLTYRIAADPTNYPSIHDKVQRGWVTRPVFWNSDILNDVGRPKAHVLYEGWHTYTIDLWDSSIIEVGSPWTSFGHIQHLRIDPLETDVPTWFWLDYVKLTAENHTSNNLFNVQFEIQEGEADSYTAELYYDTDNEGFNGTKITTMTHLSSGTHSFSWDTSSLTEGQAYYLYVVVSDGSASSRAYSPVSVRVGDYVPEPEPRSSTPDMDYDGDGKSDQVVYRAAAGTYYQNRSTEGILAFFWGGPTFVPIHGDFDGDGKTDSGLVTDINGVLFWYVTRSSDAALYWRMWGVTGDDIAIGDYNGNGRDEIAVFRSGAWFILDENDGAQVNYWGLPGDVAVPRDYDGDGIDDIAIWRPSDGMWWIINSGYANGYASEWYSAYQWGLPGDTPVAADWDGDGKADPAVYRDSLGMWYLRDLVNDTYSATQWGLPGDIPMVGDYNGDGTLDLTVYRGSVGMWYHNYRNGQTGFQQFGLPGDLLPQKAN